MIHKKHYFFAVSLLLLIIASYLYIDKSTALWCHSHLSQEEHVIFLNITQFGESTFYLLGFALGFFIFKFLLKKPLWADNFLFLFASVAASGVIVNIIKVISGRYRPSELFEKGLYGFDFFHIERALTSFPSGHTVTAFALATAVVYLWPRLSIVAWIFAIAIGISRVAIGAHYPSDVFTGAIIGYLTVIMLARYWKKISNYQP